jgi:hypothetical protein
LFCILNVGTFDIVKLLLQTIVSAFVFFSFFITYNALTKSIVSENDFFVERSIKLIGIFFFLNLLTALYVGILYLNGHQVIDFNGRFLFVSPISLRVNGFFTEPSYLGFYCGFFGILVYSVFRNWKSLAISVFSLVLLTFVIGAKFAYIAFILAIFLAYPLSKVSSSHIRFLLYFSLITIYAVASANYDSYLMNKYISMLDYEDQGSFVTRIGYVSSSLRFITTHPLGQGFGGWINGSLPYMKDVISFTNGLRNGELIEEIATGVDFLPKESFSMMIFMFGWLGAVLIIESAMKMISIAAKDPVKIALILFFYISLIVYINFMAVPIVLPFFIVLIKSLHYKRLKNL